MIFFILVGRIVFEVYKKEFILLEDMVEENGYEGIVIFLCVIIKWYICC